MTTIEDKIKSSRTIKDTSLRTYLCALKTLSKLIEPENKSPLKDTKFLHNFDNVIKHINNLDKITSKKNKLTAILVALNSDKKKNDKLIEKYSDVLKKLTDEYNEFLKTQTKTETQKQNWITYDELINVINDLMDEVKVRKLKTKKLLTSKEFDTLQQLVILRTYLSFPLRNDFADMPVLKKADYNKLSKEEQQEKNYLVIDSKNKKKFYISQYKNSKFLGNKILSVPSKLSKLINLWLKFNTSGYYLVKSDQTTPITPNGITKYLNKIFMKHKNKKISTSLLRHIIISHLAKDQPTIAEKEAKEKETENKFLHSQKMNDMYRKIDD